MLRSVMGEAAGGSPKVTALESIELACGRQMPGRERWPTTLILQEEGK
jgi:hypothetical protein